MYLTMLVCHRGRADGMAARPSAANTKISSTLIMLMCSMHEHAHVQYACAGIPLLLRLPAVHRTCWSQQRNEQ